MSKISLFVLLIVFANVRCADNVKVTVDAGEHDRQDTPVWFAMPEYIGMGPFRLLDEGGSRIALQIDGTHRACFILGTLKAGQSKSFSLEKDTDNTPAGVEAAKKGNAVEVSIGGKVVLGYQAGKTDLPKGFEAQYQRGGYIFPAFTPSGKLVIDDYPPNHKHHHGIWAPWTKTEFEGRHPDFWNMGGKSGTVEPAGDAVFASGAVYASIKAVHKFIDLGIEPPKAALNETWEITVYTLGSRDAKQRLFDLVSTQTCASESPLKLPKYYYGGLGVRGNREWNGKGKAAFLTSEGKDVTNGNETRGKWCHLGGTVNSEAAGIAILCHPDNFRSPQPMRLHPSEPFFCYAPSQLGDWEIVPVKAYVARYRFVVSDGAADATILNRLWQDYATPPVVTVK